jgi:hypothetical protein
MPELWKQLRPLRTAKKLYKSKEEVVTPFVQGADKSLARPTSPCILFDGENISFDASLVIYINSTNIQQLLFQQNAHVFYY